MGNQLACCGNNDHLYSKLGTEDLDNGDIAKMEYFLHEAKIRATHKGEIDVQKLRQVLDGRDSQGRTYVYNCVDKRQDGMLKLLLEEGADAKIADNKGHTALHRASFYGTVTTVKLLLSKDVNVNAVTTDTKSTPLHEAAANGHDEVASLLLSVNDIKVNVQNIHGHTPLHNAAGVGNSRIVSLILHKNGALLDLQDNEGRTALYKASENGHRGVVVMLLSYGAKANIPNNNGVLPSQIDTIVSTKPSEWNDIMAESGSLMNKRASLSDANSRKSVEVEL